MNLKLVLGSVVSLLFMMGQALAADSPRVAVLELQGELPATTLALLSDKVRAGVLEVTQGRDVVVMSRENMAVLAQDMGLELDCIEGACEVETGRNIGAAYVVSGAVTQLGGVWLCTVKIHQTDTGALLSTGDARAPDLVALLDGVVPMVEGLTQKALGGQFGASKAGGIVSSVGSLYLGDDIDNAFTDEKGFLFITTEPADAEVLLNGEVIGSGGAVQKEVMVGRYVLAVRHPGPYHAYVSQPFDLGTDGYKQKIELKAAFGTLMVQSAPSSAEVWIAGKRVGTTPYQDAQFPSGQVQIKLTKGFYASASKTVTVQDEQRTDVEFALSKNFGTLTVQSSPAGAEIFFGKKSTEETTPHTFEQLPPGVYAVGLKHHGYLDDFEKIDLKVGDKTTHSVDFEQAMGQMVLTSEDLHGKPCEGEVLVDGKDAGTTPMKTMAQVGEHEVQVKCGADWVIKRLTVPHNDVVRQDFKMMESRARNARIADEKRQRGQATSRARRALWGGIFANADADQPDLYVSYFGAIISPVYEQFTMDFDRGRSLTWVRLPIDAIGELGVEGWISETVMLGFEVPVSFESWGLTQTLLSSGVELNPFTSSYSPSFSPTLRLGIRPLPDTYQPLHIGLRFKTFWSLVQLGSGGSFIYGLGMEQSLEEEVEDEDGYTVTVETAHTHQLTLNILDLELSYQPQSWLVLTPAVRTIFGGVSERFGGQSVSHTFANLAAGGRVGIPVGGFEKVLDALNNQSNSRSRRRAVPTADANLVIEGWYFKGPLGVQQTDLRGYQDFGGRLFIQMVP